VPFEIRPDVRATLAASRADELVFQIGQPGIIRPLIGAGALMIPILSGVAVHA
jgi:hypothetical protein